MEKIVKITYLAIDGKEFDDYSECDAYERSITKTSGIVFFDNNMNKLDECDLEDAAIKSSYFRVDDEKEARKTISLVYELYGIYAFSDEEFSCGIRQGHVYKYTDDDHFVYLSEQFSEIKKELETILGEK